MGIFYHPPQPPTGSTAATPPLPHDPIPKQGDPPPRYTTALMLVAVLASWPADLEPRLTRPNDQQQKIAPLTLRYGQQPTPQGPLAIVEYGQLVASWPADLEPRLGRPNDQQQKIAPLTLVYGSSPPPWRMDRQVSAAASWAPDPPQPYVPEQSSAWNVPPPASVPYRPPPLAIRASWEEPPNRPPALVSIAPLTLAYGTPPVPAGPVSVLEIAQLVGTWPIGVGPDPPYAQYLNARLRGTVAVTQPSASQPIPQAPLSVVEITQIAATWAQTWDAQTAPKNAAWNVPPILSAVVYAPLPRSIWVAWEPPWIQPPPPVAIATLTLPTGTPPPIRRAGDQQIAAVNAWISDATVARQPIPSLVQAPVQALPYAPLPVGIRAAWDTPWIHQPARVVVVTLTLPIGSPPPPRAPFDRQLAAVAAWRSQPDVVVPALKPIAGFSAPPPPIVIVTQAMQWDGRATYPLEWIGSSSAVTWQG